MKKTILGLVALGMLTTLPGCDSTATEIVAMVFDLVAGILDVV